MRRRARGRGAVGGIAQCLVGLGEAMAGERRAARRSWDGGRGFEHHGGRLGDVGKFAGAGQRVLAPRDRFFALGPHRGDLRLDEALREGAVDAARLLDLLE